MSNLPSSNELFQVDLVARAATALEGTPFEAAQRAVLFDFLSTILLSEHNARHVLAVWDASQVSASGVIRRMFADA